MAKYKNHIIAFGVGIALALGILFYTGNLSTAGSSEPVAAGENFPTVQVYKSPTCGCCVEWVKHLQNNGFTVKSTDSNQMAQIKQRLGVPQEMASCHTAEVGGYVLEGHVPAREVARLLKEKPTNVTGLSVPGMPVGSPGMERGDRKDPYNVMAFDDAGRGQVFASYHQ